ncbi:hypothetical protein AVV48_gp60 [Acinetobacter phage phiAC-1]|uniref:hypothetical protein n=1 Tax=Acinetobacter phage phiAC-1 TaxID=1229760 RepID=UPI00028B1D47|nr:hypothetical protein AVV48_gp60 [Acinetobacter phage phiAC-1]AFU62309.1 hypothetical protein phiAC-1_0060 [Acinetobacter phage phiAC-1]
MLAGMPNIPGLVAPTTLANVGLSLGGAALINAVFGKKWGIFNEFGIPIILADSFVSMNHDAAASISKYPVEQGSFASYNKVNTPSMATVTLAKGGSDVNERQLFLAQLETLLKSTLFFYIITPEYVYMRYQLIGINKSRTAQNGATMLTVNLDLEEVLEAKVDYDLEEVKQPSDSNTVDGGAKTSTQRTSILSDIFGGS